MTISKKVRAQIRAWIRNQVEGKERINMAELVDEAVEHFSNDKKFMNDLGATAIPFLIRGLAHDVLGVGRHTIEFEGSIDPKSIAKARVASTPWRFDNWTEHVGDQWHVKLLDMTGADLDYAVEYRTAVGEDQLNKAEFLRTLRKKVNDDEKVGDVWDRVEIEKAYERIFGS